MNTTATGNCPFTENEDKRKSAKIAAENTAPDTGAHWVTQAALARRILRSPNSTQAGASADFLNFKNPEHAPVFFLDGKDHFNKRQKTQRFLSPKKISDQHFEVMNRVSEQLVQDFQKLGEAKLEDMSFKLAVEVVGEILGLTNSDEYGRAKRIQKVLVASMAEGRESLWGRFSLNAQRLAAMAEFYWCDVRPAIKHRKKHPKDDAISFYIEEQYPKFAIMLECLTYGTAGMLTTREFIIMVAWYLFEDFELRKQFLEGDQRQQLAILMEILRLEPVAAMIHRRIDEEVTELGDEPLPKGEKYGLDIRRANVSEEFAGECPFKVDLERAKRQKDSGRFLSFGDGQHSCPGWQVALQETRIFLAKLFEVEDIKLDREPDISWNAMLGSYELREALISCKKS